MYRGSKSERALHAEAKQLGRFYDIAVRLTQAFGLPPNYEVLGQNLRVEALKKGIFLSRASLGKFSEAVRSAVGAAISASFSPAIFKEIEPRLNQENLDKCRVTVSEAASLSQRLLARFYDPVVFVKKRRAFETLAEREKLAAAGEEALRRRLVEREEEFKRAIAAERERSERWEKMYLAMNEISGSRLTASSDRTIIENLVDSLNAATKWAWQIVGFSKKKDTESAGWSVRVVAEDGSTVRFGVKLEYLVYQPGMKLKDAKIYPLRMGAPEGEDYLTIPETQTIFRNNDGNYWAVKEWENFQVREDVVAEVDERGSRTLYRRVLRPGSEMKLFYLRGKARQLMGKKEAAVAEVGKDRLVDVDDAEGSFFKLVRAEEINSPDLGLKQGDKIRILPKGTMVELVSAGSAERDIRDRKIKEGEEKEAIFRAGGLNLGIIHQGIEDIGNIATGLFKLVGLTVEDCSNFPLRPQNQVLIKIVGVKSYTIWPLFRLNEKREVFVYGYLQTTNPEIPEAGEEHKFEEQFRTHQSYAKLVMERIIPQIQNEEGLQMLRDQLGPILFPEVVLKGNTEILRPRKIDNAAVMFADLRGFTKMSETIGDPNEIMRIISKFFDVIDPVVTRQKGIVIRHIGDAQMSLEGALKEEKDSPERAILAAIQAQRAMQEFNLSADMQGYYSQHPEVEPLAITVGIAAGEVTVGNMGNKEGKIEFDVLGPVANLASRLQGAAQAGEILVSEKTFQSLSEGFLQSLLNDNNRYNRGDRAAIGKRVAEILLKSGMRPMDSEVAKMVEHYFGAYVDATIEDLFVPESSHLKNIKEVVRFYKLKWDRHDRRDHFILQSIAAIRPDLLEKIRKN